MSAVWAVRLAEKAEHDLLDALVWTTDQFGALQADDYLETLTLAFEALTDGPNIVGSKVRDDIGLGIRTLHVARLGRKGRHLVVFRFADGQVIDVIRLLHDSMDLAKHLPD
ncbi:type II toxin-antitoxin system RelE/ParE family toxin [Limnohabitans sp. 2KL-27]|uniref:type II toxin-antitoxin system RelE/ParE family toxin n=1 Tax=Limnohabitans sp. 2KL-27 TaxID=1100705 RepID=UPI000A602D71|nr:type II toxin-antitoxin system RelE/ParE family toxin [Limnohabitans sp. 2KL-27]